MQRSALFPSERVECISIYEWMFLKVKKGVSLGMFVEEMPCLLLIVVVMVVLAFAFLK